LPSPLSRIVLCASIAILTNLQLPTDGLANESRVAGKISHSSNLVEGVEVPVPTVQIPSVKAPQTGFTPLSILHDSLWQRLSNGFELSSIDNARVEEQIKFLQRGTRSLHNNLSSAAPYLYHIVQELVVSDVPIDMALLPLIESAFNPVARSSQSAVGIWQFIPSTARSYGLSTHKKYDQRKDVVMSTTAAIRYLKDLHRIFDGDWLLALAAYNTGPGNVRAAMRRASRRGDEASYWNLKLSKETSNYVPRLIAATKMISNPKDYGLELPPLADRKQIESIAVGRQISIQQVAALLGLPVNELAELNTGLYKGITPSEGPHKITLPVEATGPLMRKLARLKRIPLSGNEAVPDDSKEANDSEFNQYTVDTKITKNSLDGFHYNSGPTKSYTYTTRVVKRGDNLWNISKETDVDIETLRAWNDLDQDKIKIGDTLKIARLELADIGPDDAKLMTYRVLPNETLASIANRFNLHIGDIKRWNKPLWNESHVQAGQLLRIPSAIH